MWTDRGCEDFCAFADYKILVRPVQNAYLIIQLHENKTYWRIPMLEVTQFWVIQPLTFNAVAKGNVQLSMTKYMLL